jgi:hypothetical protein
MVTVWPGAAVDGVILEMLGATDVQLMLYVIELPLLLSKKSAT